MGLSRFLLFLLIPFFYVNLGFAQKPVAPAVGSIAGKLVDEKNAPVSYATVTLLKSDSTVVNGDLSKDDGSFKIAPTGIGDFRLRIESIGILTKYISVQITSDAPNKKIGSIKLGETENMLGAVSVVGEKPVVELKVDKKVFNVEKNTTSAGGSAADVLQNVPSVSVDADGNVSLRGKGDVTILIDGKPTTLLGSDVASALQSLPASSIESVEVITNPSAKYDAQGSTGIINIVTKKDGRLGINGIATLGAGTLDKYNGNIGLNARKGKWNVFLNSSIRLNTTYKNSVTTDILYKDTALSSHTFEGVPHYFNGYFNTIGVSFDPDKNNSITLTENVNKMDYSFKDYAQYTIYNTSNEAGIPATYEKLYTSQSGEPVSSSTALDYKHKFKKKDEELTIDGTVVLTKVTHTQYYFANMDTFNAAGSIVTRPFSPITENAPGDGNNRFVNVWADYTDPLFTKSGKLGLGFKSQVYSFVSSNTPVIDSFGQKPETDFSLLSNYNYTQQIHAAYINWNDQIGKFSYQAGLRLEDAIYNGSGAVPNDTVFQNSFLNLFPSAFISYQLGNQQRIYLNFSRRVNRPSFRQLLPSVDLSNPSVLNTGNSALIPEFINNLEFSYNKTDDRGDNVILSTYFSYTQNVIETLTEPVSNAQQAKYGVPATDLYSFPVNIASGSAYGLEGIGHVQILPIWDATINLNFFENRFTVGNVDTNERKYLTDNNGFTYFGKLNTSVKLPKNFSLQINGNYESPKVIAEGTLRRTYWVDMALRKNFWKNKATLILNCSDIFKTHVFVTDYNLATYNETVYRLKETRIGTITFTYRFGKSDIAKKVKSSDNKLDEDKDNSQNGGDDNG